MDSYDFAFKIIVVGDSGVGKSSLLNSFCSRPFDENLGPTIGVDFKVCDINVESGASKKHIKLELWDTAGEERFRGITSVFYRNAHAALIVFDLSRNTTFKSVNSWLENLRRYCGEDIHLLLVANKCDLEQTVSSSDLEDLVYWNNIQYAETSAKKNINIKETITKIAEDLVLQHQQLLSLSSFDPGPGSIFLQHTPQQTQSYCCGYLEF